MPFQPVANTARAELIFSWDGQIVENVLHYVNLDDINVGTLTDLAEALKTIWNTYLRPLTPTAISLTTIKCTSLETEFAPGIEYTSGLPIAGTGTGTILPNNVTIAVRFLTSLRGRSYRGRAYQVGLTTALITGNVITTGYQAALGAAWAQFQSMGTDPEWQQAVVSRYQGGLLRPSGIATLVTGYQVDRTLDSQRRRLPGRGE